MCRRFTLIAEGPLLAETFKVPNPPFDRIDMRDAGPGSPVLVVRQAGLRRQIEVAHWGLIPGWVTDPNEAPKPTHARAESLAVNGTFRGAFRRKRCLVPVSWFPVAETGPLAASRTGGLLALAGLLEDWQGPHGEIMCSACLITVPSAGPLIPFTARQPAILPEATWPLWLDPAAQPRELTPLLKADGTALTVDIQAR